MSRQIPAGEKAGYLRALIDAGFRHIDAVSFVSPKAVPQMADSEEVLTLLGPHPGVEIIGIVANGKGAERARATGAVSTVGFPFSVSPTFAMRNQRQTPEQSLDELSAIREIASAGGLDTIAYLSMAFGNPYGDPWSVDLLIDSIGNVSRAGVKVISLADTVGSAEPSALAEIVRATIDGYPDLEVGVHLHGRPEQTSPLISAAYNAGCRRFDAAIGGLGGCPFAQDNRVGNLPTERVLEALNLQTDALTRLIEWSGRIGKTYA